MMLTLLQAVPSPEQVSDAFGGGIPGLLAVLVVSLSVTLWLTMRGRLQDYKEALTASQHKEDKLIEKIGPLTSVIEKQSGLIEALGREIDWERRGNRRT